MGGNALKQVVTRRYTADEYKVICDEVIGKLQAKYPNRRIESIRAYRNKPSFGDLDILFEADNFTDNVKAMLTELFNPGQIVPNSSVYSFDYKQFQIDLIFTTSALFDTSANYFAWNDLGNLVGRVAHKLGFKYGHDGLSFVLRDGSHQYATVEVSKDTRQILTFLGFDPDVFDAGFDDLEDVFKYAASSKYFNKEIFALDNRNHASRIRDRKRKTYTEFLQWIETAPNLPCYPWADLREKGGYQYKAQFVKLAEDQFPGFKAEYAKTLDKFNKWTIAKSKFNGTLISRLTGLTNHELGNFIIRLKQEKQYLNDWVVSTNQADIHDWILQQHKIWKNAV